MQLDNLYKHADYACKQAGASSVPSMLYIHVAAATTIGWQAGQKPSTSKHGDDGRGACFGTMHAARPEAVRRPLRMMTAGRSSRTTSSSDNKEAHERPTVQRRGGRRLPRTGYGGEEARGRTSTELADDR
ncbi:Os04g0247600 [Oryza sativa Japonica Group]|uniref:Os04g0247600 protein n=1 Tax=Oryza sativa subsp. japonica TaxID=39947 RepID=A0A0P0W7Z9_ORYSJ|nr:Os04g0247600 [Oryza sativa Japonica Group]